MTHCLCKTKTGIPQGIDYACAFWMRIPTA